MDTTTRIEQSIKGLVVLIISLLSSILACLLILPLEPLTQSNLFVNYLIGVILIGLLGIWISLCLVSFTLAAYGVVDCLFWEGQTIFWKWNNLVYTWLDTHFMKKRRN